MVYETSWDIKKFSLKDTLNIYVGPDREKFVIHIELLRDKSEYFYRMLRPGSRWKEYLTGILELPDVDVQAFDWFSASLYSIGNFGVTKWPEKDDFNTEEDWLLFGSVFSLADRFLCTTMKVQLAEQLWDYYINGTTIRWICPIGIPEIWNSCPTSSNIRIMIVDIWIHYANDTEGSSFQAENAMVLPDGFAGAILQRLVVLALQPPPIIMDDEDCCREYHDNFKGHICPCGQEPASATDDSEVDTEDGLSDDGD